jgi:hypothetical protein
MKTMNVTVFKVSVKYVEHYTEVQFDILIAAENEQEAIKVAKQDVKLTEEFRAYVLWQNVDYDYEPIEESIEIVGIEKFDHVIVNEPSILSQVRVGKRGDYIQRMGNWKETIDALLYDIDGYARFRRMHIDIPYSDEGIIVYYESYYENPNNAMIAKLQRCGIDPWGV